MNQFRTVFLFACTVSIMACSKKKLLESDPLNSSSTINSLADCQSLLNNREVFDQTPALGEISSDSYILSDIFWESISTADKNAYTWQVNIFEGQTGVSDYSIPYAQVHIANQVINALPRIRVSEVEQSEKDNIEGTACFLRAYAFYNLLQLFAKPYDNTTAENDYGIALPLLPDINTVYERASMKDSYDRVITDLLRAKKLLIDKVYHNQPSKPAVDAMLARVFLSMRNYIKAGEYADSCLQQYDSLMNYNDLNFSTAYPIPYLNDEILYNSNLLNSIDILIGLFSNVDSTLYTSYMPNDLRKDAFFKPRSTITARYKSGYSGSRIAFSGLATDEVYLIRAECRARTGDLERALQDVNTLLRNRYKEGSFQPYNTTSLQDALQMILKERNKELVFRGLRWTDLRRLNKEGAGIVLLRKINDKLYQLPPNDLRYTMPIPDDAIAGSKIVQNPR